MTPSRQQPNLSKDAIDDIISWIREAGKISLSHYNHVEAEFKADMTFLTAADIDIQRFLESKFRSAFPGHIFIGEENTNEVNTSAVSSSEVNTSHIDVHKDSADLSRNGHDVSKCSQTSQSNIQDSDYIWAIDPLDGTTAYALGLPGWGISIGLLYKGKPALGFFYMPQLDDLTYTTLDGHLYWNDQCLSAPICETWLPKRFLAVNATAHADFDISIRGTRSLGSVGANLVYTARGIAAAAFAAKAKLWDLVACASIIECAGGQIIYIDGTEIDYLSLLDGRTVEQPVIAAHPNILAELPQRISQRHK